MTAGGDLARARGAARPSRSLCATLALAAAVATPALADADPHPLGGLSGNAERGRAIVLDRASGNCLICHKVPVADEAFQGDLGPDLTDVGARLSAGQIRFRLVDQSRLNPDTLMPPFHRTTGLNRVADRFAGQPALSAQQIEDVVAWLATLKD